MHFFDLLFDNTFRSHELIAARDSALEVLRVLALYVIGRIVINRSAARIAHAMVAGQRSLHLLSDDATRGREQTLAGLIRSVGQYALFFVFMVLFLRALNFDAVSVVTSASVAGIAFGVGAQKLVRDVIAGFFIIMENQYVVGDYVSINTVTGIVEEIGMRIVKVRDDTGKLYIIANGDITQVCNQSRGAISGVVEFGVPPGTDIEKVRTVVNEAVKSLAETQPEIGLTKTPTFQGAVGGDSTRTIVRTIVEVQNPAKLADATVAVRDASHAALLAASITPF